ncbi:MAG: endonuclease domain-containing protein [Proteobacteria bacterium]|nr:endonuclease domain-containing protein [Pseudomonadota bacterium]
MAGPDPIIERARGNRKNPTNAETRMWSLLRDRRLNYKFRRQHPIGPYVVDFACSSIHLIIEVDGPSHSDPEQRAFDAMRSEYLRLAGWTILRVPNEHVYLSLGEVEAAIRGILEP